MDEPSTAGWHTGDAAGPYASMVASGAAHVGGQGVGAAGGDRARSDPGMCLVSATWADGPDVNHPCRRPGPRLRCGRPADLGKRPARVPLDGREKYWLFSAVSGTSLVEPSIDATRSPQQNLRGAGSAAEPSPEPRPASTGPATASNSMCSGSDPTWPSPRARLEMWTAATAAPARHPPHRADQAAHPAAASPGGGDTARRPAFSSPGRSRSCGRGTATTPTRCTPPAGLAATGEVTSWISVTSTTRSTSSGRNVLSRPTQAAAPPVTLRPTRRAPPRDHPTDDHQTGHPNRRVAAQINLRQGHWPPGLAS